MPERAHHRHAARLVHAMPGRVRLRFSGLRTHELMDMRERIAGLSGVTSAQADPRTGSILIHGEDLGENLLATLGRDIGVFLASEPEIRTLIDHLSGGFGAVDARIRQWSGGRLDLASIAALALLGGAAIQLLRGRFAASSVTMLWYAASTAMAIRSHQGGSPA